MAGSFTDNTENKIIDHARGKTTWALPSVWVGLYTAAPSDAGGGTEVTGGSYARKSTAGADWNAAASGSGDNANAITFVTATADWGTVTHFGLFDAASGGNLIAWASLTASRTILNGDTAQFAANTLVLTQD